MEDFSSNRGPAFLALGWTLSSLAIIATVLRLYSRVLLTRSAGSDDLFVTIAVVSSVSRIRTDLETPDVKQCLTIFGQIGDCIAVKHGLGRHEQYLNTEQISTVTKWSVSTSESMLTGKRATDALKGTS